jgi:hypothetical protein
MICEPKPENEVEFIELTGHFLDLYGGIEFQAYSGFHGHLRSPSAGGYIRGLWGSTVDGVENLQAFTLGDFLCRQPHEHADQWIVRRTLFLNTYSELGK